MEKSTYEDVIYEVDGPAAVITIDRQDRLNAFRGQTVEELIHAFKRGWADQSVRGLILTGAGTRAFCVGGDVKQRAETGNYGPTSNGLFEVTYLHRLIRDVPKPVIAAVNGLAIGGGHVLHVLCDLSIAADHAKFGQAGPRVGSFDGGFGSAYLARVVGEKRAREIWFLLEQYSAEQAERWGGSPTSPPTRSSTDPDFKNPYPERSWSPHPAGRVRHRLSACLLPAQFGHAFGAPAGPAGTQAGPSAAAGRAQPG